MQRLDPKTRAGLVRAFYQSGNSPSAGIRRYKTENDLRKDPCSVSAVTRLVDKFETFGCICDRPRSGRPSFSDETIEEVEREMKEQQASTPLNAASCRNVAKRLEMPLTSVHKILRVKLQMKPYRIKHLQALTENDFTDRLEFAHWFLESCANDREFLEDVLWTDEAHFYLHGQVSSQNCMIWSKENPQAFTTSPLHSPKITVWCGFTAKCILPPFFFSSTVTGAAYLEMLRSHLKRHLPRARKNITFQQDGAPPHIANPVKAFLNETFGDRVISRHFPRKWPARSPDLNPADYWLWGQLKHNIYSKQPKTLEDLRDLIEREVREIDVTVMKSAVLNLVDRLNLVIQLDGGHIEHVF